jgi:hypothetical protein
MRLLAWLISLGVIIAGSMPVEAAKHARSTAKKSDARKSAEVKRKAARQGELKTDFKFDDHDLLGQYQTPDEALAKVENEKSLSDLLGVRKHFKDRLQIAAEQE